MTVEQDIVIGLLSVFSAFVAGLLGAGGDILYVPLLLYALPAITDSGLPIHTVTALSLAGSLASTGGGGVKYWRDGRLDERAMAVSWWALGSGALLGGLLSRIVSSDTMLAVFAVVTTGAAVALFVPARAAVRTAPLPRDPVAAGLLAAVGLICGAVGVGGGFLIILVLLHRMRLPAADSRATGLALTCCTAAPALLGKALTGQVAWAPLPLIVAGALGGVWLGANVSARVPGAALRFGLAGLVVVLGVRVWFDVLAVSA